MSNKRPLNLTLEPEIIAWLDQIMERRHYTSRSILVEELIRERHDQVFGTGPQGTAKHPERFPEHHEEVTRLEEKPPRRKKTGT